MADERKVLDGSPSSSDSQIPKEIQKHEEAKSGVEDVTKDEKGVDVNYPPPWKWEKFFVGGYDQSRMLRFKKPKTMYTAINLFAGVAIMFYGYDQGVMSQVNLNEDYWNYSRHSPVSEKENS